MSLHFEFKKFNEKVPDFFLLVRMRKTTKEAVVIPRMLNRRSRRLKSRVGTNRWMNPKTLEISTIHRTAYHAKVYKPGTVIEK